MATEHTRATRTALALGGTGKTGRRVAARLTARGLPVRIGSRSGEPRFDWEDRSTWFAQNVSEAYWREHVKERALGREPRDFRDYARGAASTGIWIPRATRAA